MAQNLFRHHTGTRQPAIRNVGTASCRSTRPVPPLCNPLGTHTHTTKPTGSTAIADGGNMTPLSASISMQPTEITPSPQTAAVRWEARIPLFTRSKQLVPTTGYTGSNPYVAYRRQASIVFTAEIEDAQSAVRTVKDPCLTIQQMRRIVNPTGIWRSKLIVQIPSM